MALVLHPHRSCRDTQYRVENELRLQGRRLRWRAEVRAPAGTSWHTSPRFGADWRKNWELWNYDVVEAFLQPREREGEESAPYLELQVSPTGQALALMIMRPRQVFYTPMALDLRVSAKTGDGLWVSEVEVALPPELRSGPLHGGLFACLGSGQRSFLALAPNPEERPDFHRPELFCAL